MNLGLAEVADFKWEKPNAPEQSSSTDARNDAVIVQGKLSDIVNSSHRNLVQAHCIFERVIFHGAARRVYMQRCNVLLSTTSYCAKKACKDCWFAVVHDELVRTPGVHNFVNLLIINVLNRPRCVTITRYFPCTHSMSNHRSSHTEGRRFYLLCRFVCN